MKKVLTLLLLLISQFVLSNEDSSCITDQFIEEIKFKSGSFQRIVYKKGSEECVDVIKSPEELEVRPLSLRGNSKLFYSKLKNKGINSVVSNNPFDSSTESSFLRSNKHRKIKVQTWDCPSTFNPLTRGNQFLSGEGSGTGTASIILKGMALRRKHRDQLRDGSDYVRRGVRVECR